MNGLFLFCYHFYGFSPFLELRYLFYSRSSHVSVVPILRSYFPIYEWFVPIFVIILMGYHLFLRHFFFSGSSLVSFVHFFISFFPSFTRSFVHILLIQKFTCGPTLCPPLKSRITTSAFFSSSIKIFVQTALLVFKSL